MATTYLFFVLLSVFNAVAQVEFLLEKEFNVHSDFIRTDALGNFYSIHGAEIIKTDIEKNQKTSYGNTGNGEITSVDTSDPFRILLFYKDFNKIVFLNRSLSEITSPISLDKLGFFNVSAACQSINGGFWIFDESFNQLVYINDVLEISKRSAPLSELMEKNGKPNQVLMLEKNEYIYLGIYGKGIFLFDNYGTYIKTFPIEYDSMFQVNNAVISYKNNGKLCFYNSFNYNENCVILPKQECKQMLVENGKLFANTGQKVFIYRIKNL